MLGYSKTHHVWFARNDGWYPVGVGKNHPIDVKELDNAIEIADEALKRAEVRTVMVIVKETARFTSLLDAHEYDMTTYTGLTAERLGLLPF